MMTIALGVVLFVAAIGIAILADAILTLRKTQRSCEKLIAACEEAVNSIKDKGV